jgi:hypothetical protein
VDGEATVPPLVAVLVSPPQERRQEKQRQQRKPLHAEGELVPVPVENASLLLFGHSNRNISCTTRSSLGMAPERGFSDVRP